jgi:hypothetical protein
LWIAEDIKKMSDLYWQIAEIEKAATLPLIAQAPKSTWFIVTSLREESPAQVRIALRHFLCATAQP